jgi:hypothetical protein
MPCLYPKIIGRETAVPSPLMAGHTTRHRQNRICKLFYQPDRTVVI